MITSSMKYTQNNIDIGTVYENDDCFLFSKTTI